MENESFFVFSKIYKRYKLKRKKTAIEPEEILLDEPKEGDGRDGLPEDYLEKRIEYSVSPKIFFWLKIAILMFFLVGLASCFRLAVLNHEFWQERAQANITQYFSIAPPRGLIFDRFGEILTENIPLFSAVLIPQDLPKDYKSRQEVFRRAESIFGEKIDFSFDKNGEIKDVILLKEELTHDQMLLLESQDLDGIEVVKGVSRHYKEGLVFSHILGYLGREAVNVLEGRSGIEAFYDVSLRGIFGKKQRQRLPEGGYREVVMVDPEAGKNLVLTIDAGFQKVAFQRLQEALRSIGSKAGVVLALNPQNGEILSLVSLPSFDANIFESRLPEEKFRELTEDPDKPFFNRAISGLYSPGSIIKPLIALAALEEKIISPKQQVFCPGFLRVENPYFPDRPSIFGDWRPHGEVDLKEAIAQSCNVYFYTIGGGFEDFSGLGIEKIIKYLKRFNFGQTLGIDIYGEASGFIPNPNNRDSEWLLGDTYNISIGQGELRLTPLQIASYISAIVNGGVLWQPRLVISVAGQRIEPKKLRSDLASPKNLAIVKEGMLQTVVSPLGTGHLLSDLPISAGGKSGTVEVGRGQEINAFFVAFAPYKKPEIVLLVIVEDAREGALNAVPVAKDLLLWYYENRLNR